MDKHQNAINYVIKLIKSLDSTAEIEVTQPGSYQYSFCIDIKGQRLEIIFNGSRMDDFEYEITKDKGTDRYYASEGFIKFQVYAVLGQAGVISNFDISAEILNEKRDWLQNYSAKFEKPAWLYEIFYQGLKKLSIFLAGLVRKYKSLPEEIKKEQEDINHLIEWHDKHHRFNDNGISASTLGYFKAAAVCVILDKENERELIAPPRILKAKDKEIYSIVSEMRENPFPQIKMPDCIYDYAEYVRAEKNNKESEKLPTKELVFVACGQSTPREKALGVQVKDLLKKHNIDSFLAETANDLESLNSHIFKNLTNCTGFIAILHKRDPGKYNTSVWINQEVGIVAFLRSSGKRIPSLVLYQEGADVQGLIKYTIANPSTFKTDSQALSRIEDWVKQQNFDYVNKFPEIDIILKEKRKQFGSISGGRRNGYHNIRYELSFRVRNKSDVNVCLEDIKIDNEILGVGALDKTNFRLIGPPFNIGPRMTEKVNLCINFPNVVGLEKAGKDITLQFYLEFADRTIEVGTIGYFK